VSSYSAIEQRFESYAKKLQEEMKESYGVIAKNETVTGDVKTSDGAVSDNSSMAPASQEGPVAEGGAGGKG
jgi:hypothetical protein